MSITVLSDEEFFDLPKGKHKRNGRIVGEIIDEVSVTGLEIVRSNAPVLTKEIMKFVLHVILYENELTMMDGRIKERWRAIKNGDVPFEEAAVPVGIQKKLDSYGGTKDDGSKKGIPYHIRAAVYSNTWLGKRLSVGDKPLICYVKAVPRNYDKTHVIAVERGEDWPEGFEIDWDQHARICIENPLNNLLRGIGRSFDEVVSDFENTGAMDFF